MLYNLKREATECVIKIEEDGFALLFIAFYVQGAAEKKEQWKKSQKNQVQIPVVFSCRIQLQM